MFNKAEYMRMIFSLKKGEIIEIPVANSRSYKSQRMTAYRALLALKNDGFDDVGITITKCEKGNLRIINPISNKIFTKIVDGVRTEVPISDLDTPLTEEEKEFEKWTESVSATLEK